ncbi:MAG: cytochrome c3 family protein [Magnetococcales bacterium]|nr:cytochrome c3 family protein [Magnetococcales bacterium]
MRPEKADDLNGGGLFGPEPAQPPMHQDGEDLNGGGLFEPEPTTTTEPTKEPEMNLGGGGLFDDPAPVPPPPATPAVPSPATATVPSLINTAATETDRIPTKAVLDEAWVTGGGWYRHGSTLYYLPGGHADPFLTAWLEIAIATSGQPEGDALKTVMTGREAPGQCDKCHMGIQAPLKEGTQPAPFSWKSINGFQAGVRFGHRTHRGNQGGCVACHSLIKHASEGPTGPHRGLSPMSREGCTQQCHDGDHVDASCRSCHAYHPAP